MYLDRRPHDRPPDEPLRLRWQEVVHPDRPEEHAYPVQVDGDEGIVCCRNRNLELAFHNFNVIAELFYYGPRVPSTVVIRVQGWADFSRPVYVRAEEELLLRFAGTEGVLTRDSTSVLLPVEAAPVIARLEPTSSSSRSGRFLFKLSVGSSPLDVSGEKVQIGGWVECYPRGFGR